MMQNPPDRGRISIGILNRNRFQFPETVCYSPADFEVIPMGPIDGLWPAIDVNRKVAQADPRRQNGIDWISPSELRPKRNWRNLEKSPFDAPLIDAHIVRITHDASESQLK